MIESADEFVRLRTSPDPVDYNRAAGEPAEISTWLEVIHRYPDMRGWVAHNKTVPHAVLTILAGDPDPDVHWTVARKRKLLPELMIILAADSDEGVRGSLAYHPKLTDQARVNPLLGPLAVGATTTSGGTSGASQDRSGPTATQTDLSRMKHDAAAARHRGAP